MYIGGVCLVFICLMFSVIKEEVECLLEDGWNEGGQVIFGLFFDFFYDQEINDVVVEFVWGKIKEVVKDFYIVEVLMLWGYFIFLW